MLVPSSEILFRNITFDFEYESLINEDEKEESKSTFKAGVQIHLSNTSSLAPKSRSVCYRLHSKQHFYKEFDQQRIPAQKSPREGRSHAQRLFDLPYSSDVPNV